MGKVEALTKRNQKQNQKIQFDYPVTQTLTKHKTAISIVENVNKILTTSITIKGGI